jgi:hypothetical protein
MTGPAPSQEWWTSAEIAEARLPDMPTARQPVEKVIARGAWRETSLARRRSGRGGGWEYHWSLLPIRAQAALLKTATVSEVPAPAKDRDEAWSWFEGLPETVKAEARRRLRIVQMVEGLEALHGKHLSVHMTASAEKVGARTIWAWFALVDGIPVHDRLAYLAPRHRAGSTEKPRRVAREFLDLIKSDYLRPERPSFTSCYRRQIKVALKKGWDVPPEKTMRRAFDREVSKTTVILARRGVDALKRMTPAQVRDKSALRPLEAVNADGHIVDVFVQWPAEPGQPLPKPQRPHLIAFQDIFSGRILSWIVDITLNRRAVQLAAGDMIQAWGIPEHVLFDNGKEFANKPLTAGTERRFRYTHREDDVPGLFALLGCKVHFATPYSGQSKPIERAFRDFCDAIAKDPRFSGAYTGNKPDAKPENYASRAIPLDTFLRVLGEGIAEHNTRQGRRSEVAWGRSFAEVFDEGYATAPIRKATEAQRRLWMLGAEGVSAQKPAGQVVFMGNEYWAPWMREHAGQRIVIRFEPADLHSGIHVYAADGRYLGDAPCRQKTGFFCEEDARLIAKERKSLRKVERAFLDQHRKFTARELGLMQDELQAFLPETPPEAKVVRGVFKAGPAQPKPLPAPRGMTAQEARVHAEVTDLTARLQSAPAEEDVRAKFRRALQLECAIADGEAVTDEQRQWLAMFQRSAGYRGERKLYEDFGDAMFG